MIKECVAIIYNTICAKLTKYFSWAAHWGAKFVIYVCFVTYVYYANCVHKAWYGHVARLPHFF